MPNKALLIIGVLIIMAFFGAFAVPEMTSAAKETNNATYTLEPGENRTVTEGLMLTLDTTSNDQASLTLTDTETGQETAYTLNESETAAYSLPGGDGNVTLVESNNQDAMVQVEYEPTFGWNEPSKRIAENVGFLMVVVLLVIIGGSAAAVIHV